MFDEFHISENDKNQIKPLSDNSANKVWNQYISSKNRHPMLLEKADWPTNHNIWFAEGGWQEEWNSEKPEIPSFIENNLKWIDEEIIFFMYGRGSVIETTWSVFKRSWKCFLLNGEGPFLISPYQKEVIWFGPTGNYKIGIRC